MPFQSTAPVGHAAVRLGCGRQPPVAARPGDDDRHLAGAPSPQDIVLVPHHAHLGPLSLPCTPTKHRIQNQSIQIKFQSTIKFKFKQGFNHTITALQTAGISCHRQTGQATHVTSSSVTVPPQVRFITRWPSMPRARSAGSPVTLTHFQRMFESQIHMVKRQSLQEFAVQPLEGVAPADFAFPMSSCVATY